MVDYGLLVGALQGANGAIQVLRGAIDTRDAVKISDALSDTMAKLMSANSAALDLQAKMQALMTENQALAVEIKQLKNWEQERLRYDLRQVGVDKVLVYQLKEAERAGVPDHFLCAACFGQGVKSILQPDVRMPGRDEFLVCGTCGADLLVQGVRRADHGKVPSRRR